MEIKYIDYKILMKIISRMVISIKLYFVISILLFSSSLFAFDNFHNDSADSKNPFFITDGIYIKFSFWESYIHWNQPFNDSYLLLKNSMYPLKGNDEKKTKQVRIEDRSIHYSDWETLVAGAVYLGAGHCLNF